MLTSSRSLAYVTLILAACVTLTACGASQKPTSSDKSTSSAQPTSSKATETLSVASSSAAQPQAAELAPHGSLAPATVVASVEGRQITLGQARHAMATSGTSKQEVPEPPNYSACIAHRQGGGGGGGGGQSPAQLKEACQRRYEELLRPALNSLIHAQWLLGQAREEGLKVDQAALGQELAQGLKLGAEVHQTPASTGKSIADLKSELGLGQLANLIYEAIKRHTPRVTEQRIAGYYDTHKQSFLLPQRRDLKIIRTSSEASAKKALGELRAGRSFASVLKEDPTSQPIYTKNGLLLGFTRKSFAEPLLSNAIFNARPHTLSGPVRISLGYYVFEVTRRIPAEQLSYAKVKAQIAQQLPEVLHAQTLKAFVAAFRKKWTARSDCRAGYVVEDCRQYSRAQPPRDSFTL